MRFQYCYLISLLAFPFNYNIMSLTTIFFCKSKEKDTFFEALSKKGHSMKTIYFILKFLSRTIRYFIFKQKSVWEETIFYPGYKNTEIHYF